VKFLFLSSYAHLALDPETDRVSGGAELQVALMARELAQRGHEVVLVSGDHGQPDNRVLQGVRSRLGGRFHTGGVGDLAGALPIVNRIIREERPDWIFVYGWTTWLFFLLQARSRGCTRLGFTCMLDTEINGEFRRENPVRGALFDFGMRRSDARFAITDYQLAEFHRRGMSCSLYRPLVLPRSNPRSASKDIDFLWIARCHPIKRPHIFLDLVERNPNARCVMISPKEDAELWATVRDRAQQLPNLEFRERVPYHSVQEFYDRAQIFVNTSEFEGFANSYIQAGQGEAAILALSVNSDGVLTRFNAGLCADDDKEKFFQAAVGLLEDAEQLRACQKGATRFVEEWHDNGRNVDAFLSGLPR
jgi:glycosyltransferase involved in cell wall biosynthesis